MSTNQSREPLLYIMQPAIKYPKANMQETFIVAKTSKAPNKPLLNKEAKNKYDTQMETALSAQDEQVIENEDHQDQLLEQKKEKKGRKKVPSNNKNLEAKEVQEIIHQYHQNQSEKEQSPSPSESKRKQHPYSFKRVKSFKEMNIQEKLNYLDHFPKQLPPVPCIFISKNSSIKGFLLHVTEEVIEIKQFNDKTVELSINEITEIKMIGLR